MLKALLKKQASELFAILFLGAARSASKKKKSKSSDKSSFILKGTLIAIIFTILFVAVCFWALGMFEGLVKAGFDWMYFFIFGFVALIASIAFNAFVSYNMIFKARDNTLLLSMPIPPRIILFSRMAILFMNCVIFTTLFWLPSVLIYLAAKFNVAALICGVSMLFVIAMISLALACLVGWIVALILRNKTTKIILGILGSLVVICLAVFFRVAMNFMMVGIIQNINSVDEFMRENFPWILTFGKAASGDVASFLIMLAIGLVFLGAIYLIMSKTFMFIVTAKTGGKHKVYKATEQKSKKLNKSLLNKEFSFLFKTPVYLINAGLGSVFILIVLVLCCFGIPMFNETLPLLRELSVQPGVEFPFNFINQLIPFGIMAVPIFCTAFSTLSTPSISIEGKTLWILKSLPIKPFEVFRAKLNMHAIYCLIPSVIFIVFLGVLCKESALSIFIMIVGIITFTYLTAYFGLFIGTIRANLIWINITMPVKQSLAVGLSLIFNMLSAVIFITAYPILMQVSSLSSQAYIIAFAILWAIISFIFDRWLRSSGCKRFMNL